MTNSNIETPPFITALKTGGTKEEAIFALERLWEEMKNLRNSTLRECAEIAATLNNSEDN